MATDERSADAMNKLRRSLERRVRSLRKAKRKEKNIEAFYDEEFRVDKFEDYVLLYKKCFQAYGIQRRRQFKVVLANLEPTVKERLEKVQKRLEEIAEKADTELEQNYSSKFTKDFDGIQLWIDSTQQYLDMGRYFRTKKEKYTLIIVTRYYGSYYCDRHLRDIHSRRKDFEKHSCNIVVITKGTHESLQAWKEWNKLYDFTACADDRKQFVAKFGFKRCAFNLFNSEFLLKWTEFTLGEPGKMYGATLEKDPLMDINQLGGDMLITNRDCSILFDRRCATPWDRPSAAVLLRLVAEMERRDRGEVSRSCTIG